MDIYLLFIKKTDKPEIFGYILGFIRPKKMDKPFKFEYIQIGLIF